MSTKNLILIGNILGFFCQFFFGRNALIFFLTQLGINFFFLIFFYLGKNKEMVKVFSLSCTVLLLIGPVLIFVGGALLFAACLMGGINHHR